MPPGYDAVREAVELAAPEASALVADFERVCGRPGFSEQLAQSLHSTIYPFVPEGLSPEYDLESRVTGVLHSINPAWKLPKAYVMPNGGQALGGSLLDAVTVHQDVIHGAVREAKYYVPRGSDTIQLVEAVGHEEKHLAQQATMIHALSDRLGIGTRFESADSHRLAETYLAMPRFKTYPQTGDVLRHATRFSSQVLQYRQGVALSPEMTRYSDRLFEAFAESGSERQDEHYAQWLNTAKLLPQVRPATDVERLAFIADLQKTAAVSKMTNGTVGVDLDAATVPSELTLGIADVLQATSRDPISDRADKLFDFVSNERQLAEARYKQSYQVYRNRFHEREAFAQGERVAELYRNIGR